MEMWVSTPTASKVGISMCSSDVCHASSIDKSMGTPEHHAEQCDLSLCIRSRVESNPAHNSKTLNLK